MDALSPVKPASAAASRDRGGHDGAAYSSGAKHSSSVPASARGRLQMLFREIEKEFEAVHIENAKLREKLARLEKGEKDILFLNWPS